MTMSMGMTITTIMTTDSHSSRLVRRRGHFPNNMIPREIE
jgi:hypothetical protein